MGLCMREKIKISVTNLYNHAIFHIKKGLRRTSFIWTGTVSSETCNMLSTRVMCKLILKHTAAFKDSPIIKI